VLAALGDPWIAVVAAGLTMFAIGGSPAAGRRRWSRWRRRC
jgi:hypothetical protein